MDQLASERPRHSFDCAEEKALLRLLEQLAAQRYRFVTPTPASHERVLARPDRRLARDLRDVLGWSLPFDRARFDPKMLRLLDDAGLLREDGGLTRSRLRVSSLQDDLFLHSAFPTTEKDAVFFGPDSYRFANLIRAELEREPLPNGAHIVDVGTGSGVGAVAAARASTHARITMTDINPAALRLARINTEAAGIEVEPVSGADLAGVRDPIDLVLANPPYIIDDEGRDYRDGGGMHGCAVALEMARMALPRLAPTGRMILYTGSAIIDGKDPLCAALAKLAGSEGCTLHCREIDPDVFGEELSRPAYADVERIALIAAVIRRG